MNELISKINSALVAKSQKYYIPLALLNPVNIQAYGENVDYVVTIHMNLKALGFGLRPDFLRTLSYMGEEALRDVYFDIVKILKEITGAHRAYFPMYPNFPQQVIEASDLELFINATSHYMGDLEGVRVMPSYELEIREELPDADVPNLADEEVAKVRVISLGGLNDVISLFKSIVTSNSSISIDDKELVQSLFEFLTLNKVDVPQLVYSLTIPFKENKAIMTELLVANCNSESEAIEVAAGLVDTVTDVLRYTVWAHSLSQDVSLSRKPIFSRISRKHRRIVVALIDKLVKSKGISNVLEEVVSRREVWVRLAEKLHAGEFSSKFPHAVEFFNALKNKKELKSFMGKLDVAFIKQDIAKAIELLATRPGIFSRSINRVLSKIDSEDKASQLESAFSAVVDNVATPVLLQVYAQMKADKAPSRIFLPKGITSKFFVDTPLARPKPVKVLPSKVKVEVKETVSNSIANKLGEDLVNKLKSVAISTAEAPVVEESLPIQDASEPEVSVQVSLVDFSAALKPKLAAIVEAALVSRFTSFGEMGNVFIDPALKDIYIPAGFRSASKSFKTLSRGSKVTIPLEKGKPILRSFIWWKDMASNPADYYSGRVDIDSSFIFYDENYNVVDHCSFTKLRGEGFMHSGDITSAPNGAAEFIDINKAKLNPKIRYAVMVINSYSAQKYSELDECFAGVMFRSEGQKGDIFDARTVEHKFDLTSDTQAVVPVAVDLKDNKLIWLDASISGISGWHMVEEQSTRIGYLLQGFNEQIRPNLYDLFSLHVAARGTMVSSPEEADFTFSFGGDVSPFNYEIISSEYMADEPPKVEKDVLSSEDILSAEVSKGLAAVSKVAR